MVSSITHLRSGACAPAASCGFMQKPCKRALPATVAAGGFLPVRRRNALVHIPT
ncbi:hypothetical protein ASZ90_009523 [hydrocarbon metagenome]|uniref:Uncharacterized protein n=1 Tax=hydrocarbon metagenome TaxID=938273 RepID=A0A0W8FK83_9ZZZZ